MVDAHAREPVVYETAIGRVDDGMVAAGPATPATSPATSTHPALATA